MCYSIPTWPSILPNSEGTGFIPEWSDGYTVLYYEHIFTFGDFSNIQTIFCEFLYFLLSSPSVFLRPYEPILFSIYYFEKKKIIIKWLCLHKLPVNRSNGKVSCRNVVLTAPTLKRKVCHLIGCTHLYTLHHTW